MTRPMTTPEGRDELVLGMRSDGASYADVARALGVTNTTARNAVFGAIRRREERNRPAPTVSDLSVRAENAVRTYLDIGKGQLTVGHLRRFVESGGMSAPNIGIGARARKEIQAVIDASLDRT